MFFTIMGLKAITNTLKTLTNPIVGLVEAQQLKQECEVETNDVEVTLTDAELERLQSDPAVQEIIIRGQKRRALLDGQASR